MVWRRNVVTPPSPSLASRWRTHLYAVLGYTALAVVCSWPLVTHLGTHLTGTPAGDTGVYVWNQWVFQHELIDHRQLPYVTNTLFGAHHRANLSLHNYTALQNLIAAPLIRPLGVVTTFNVVYLLMIVWTAHATFMLARQVTGRAVEAWLAGALFAWSPILVTRGTAHFSLVAAAPLALFLLLLARVREHRRLRDAAALGATVWLAASTDVYYAVYCVIIATVVAVPGLVRFERLEPQDKRRAMRWGLDVLLFSLGGLVVAMLITGGWQFTFLGRQAFVRSLYTPVLALTVLTLARLAWRYRPSFAAVNRRDVWQFLTLTAAVSLVAAVMMSPVLYAAAQRILDGEFDTPRIFWRSSPPGEDLLAWLIPNPNHWLAPAAFSDWLSRRPNGFVENVASVSWIALGILGYAWWSGWKPPRRWLGLTFAFAALALGPFIVVGGINTHVPGPWALLRYVPVVGLARTPTRFAVVAMLGFAVLFAAALAWLTARDRARRRELVAVVGLLLLAELVPAPIPLYSAAVPVFYRRVAAAPADAVVLELPFGVRDGASNIGDFSALSQYFQTSHGKVLMGGYLSRMPRRRMAELQQDPVLNGLVRLSEQQVLPPSDEAALIDLGPTMVDRENVRFVVIDRSRASAALQHTAIRALRLHLVETDGSFDLYEPQRPLDGQHSSADSIRR